MCLLYRILFASSHVKNKLMKVYKQYAVVKKNTGEIVRLGRKNFYDSPGKIRGMLKTSRTADWTLLRWDKNGEREDVSYLYEIAEFEVTETIKSREPLYEQDHSEGSSRI